jgi:hypothetical protein
MWIASAQSTAPAVRLEAGIAKEEVEGDLRSATEIYQKIAADSSAPRDVRAKALLHIGGCYEKLGKQARQVYEQIVRDYADQPAASQARSRLAALRQQEHPAAPVTMTVRKIELSEGMKYVWPSDTDGQRIVYFGSDGALTRCREQFNSSRLDRDRNTSACRASGSKPNCRRAKPTASNAASRSSQPITFNP